MPGRIRALTSREKNILALAVGLALVFILFNGVPAVRELYQERAQRIAELRTEIEREQRLLENSAQWQQRRVDINAQLQALEARLFVAEDGARAGLPTAPVMAANIQRLVRQHAQETGVTITSTSLAESMQENGWLLVEQSLAFSLDNQSAAMDFLARLDTSEPWLAVSHFSMRRARDQYTGDITVVGFSRDASATAATAGE